MQFSIIEEDKRKDLDSDYWSKRQPLTYRISLTINEKQIILKREYFYAGYNDGEEEDGFYFDNEVPWRSHKSSLGISRATFFTRNFDPDYLKQKETELINIFYDKLLKSEKNLKKDLEKEIKEHNKQIEFYKKCQNSGPFMKIQRKNKLMNLY